MALTESRPQRILTLCALYVAQGVPWGFMLIALPSYLSYHYKSEISVDDIGTLKAIILVPWSFKLVWAPIMDAFTIRSMGRRRAWIIGSELMMAITLLGFIGLGDLSDKVQPILVMYFIHNCFASLQDVCTDALAVDVLPIQEYGQMNGLMWGSKLVGKAAGATGLSFVLNWGGMEACIGVQILLLLGIMLIPMFILERPGEKRFPWSPSPAGADPLQTNVCPTCGANRIAGSTTCTGCGEKLTHPAEQPAVSRNVRHPREVLREYLRAFSMTTLLVYVLFALSKLVGVGINEVIINTLCTKELDPNWSDVEFSTVSGLYTLAPIIIGTFLGGYVADRYGRRLILCFGFGGYGIAAMIYAANPQLWNEDWFTTTYILTTETLNAIGSVGFLSMAMRISWTTAAATVFTTYMTLSNVSHVVGNKLAGPVQSWLASIAPGETSVIATYEYTFWFAGVASILPLLLLVFVQPDRVDEARAADDASGQETPSV